MSVAVQPVATVAVDPPTALARLAAGGFGDYVGYERQGVWTFAADPLAELLLDTTHVELTSPAGSTRTPWKGQPADVLARGCTELRAAGTASGIVAGGDVLGWVGFEFCAVSDGGVRAGLRTATAAGAVAPLQVAHLILPRLLVRITGTVAEISGGTPEECARITELLAAPPQPLPMAQPVSVTPDPSDYRGRVAEAVGEIAAGRYDKVILSRQVDIPFGVDIPATYRLGRAHNTPARSFLLRLGGLETAGFSPELVVAVDAAGLVTAEPLAGTRAYGRGEAADEAARAELESDPKEIVEHTISVRAAVADMASVATTGTVTVPDFMAVRTRGSVQHLGSTVRGQLASGRTAWDAFASLFPAVTASGIPKSAAIEAISRLDTPRGIYSGAVVMVSPEDALEAALVLRCVYQQDGHCWLRAGAGIVAQSRPEREFTETCEKLGSIAPYVVPAS